MTMIIVIITTNSIIVTAILTPQHITLVTDGMTAHGNTPSTKNENGKMEPGRGGLQKLLKATASQLAEQQAQRRGRSNDVASTRVGNRCKLDAGYTNWTISINTGLEFKVRGGDAMSISRGGNHTSRSPLHTRYRKPQSGSPLKQGR